MHIDQQPFKVPQKSRRIRFCVSQAALNLYRPVQLPEAAAEHLQDRSAQVCGNVETQILEFGGTIVSLHDRSLCSGLTFLTACASSTS